MKIRYEIFKAACKDSVENTMKDLLAQIKTEKGIVKMSLFFDCSSDKQYQSIVKDSQKCLSNKWKQLGFGISFIAQKPLDCDLVLEIMYVDQSEKLVEKSHNDIVYKVLEFEGCKQLFLSGICGEMDATIYEQAKEVFHKVEKILDLENMEICNLIRQWNYIPQITGERNGLQNYQEFNDARSGFYGKTIWGKGYPAATGIGTEFGPLIIDFIASKGHEKEFSIINPKQIDAHVYSGKVLISNGEKQEKTTPKFERAKLVEQAGEQLVFVSGTAAILGERSLSEEHPLEQTNLTLDNIESLIDEQNLKNIGVESLHSEFNRMRCYIKRETDFNLVKEICENRYPEVPFVYLKADVCREELLVEIEAFVS